MLKNFYCIVGPSGCGKTTVSELLRDQFNLKLVDSYTTRAPRFEGETGHIFISTEEFKQLGKLVAYTKFDNNEYGVTEEAIDNNDIYVIDPAGIEYLKQNYSGNRHILVIGLSANIATVVDRMRNRGDQDDKILNRLVNDSQAFSNLNLISDIVIHTDNLSANEVCKQVLAVINEFEGQKLNQIWAELWQDSPIKSK